MLNTDDVLASALAYAARGFHVFPVDAIAKRPLTAHGHFDATTDEKQIRAWYAATPHADVAIALAPSGLVALDVDIGTRADGSAKLGAESLARLEALHPSGTLDTPLIARTGGGGIHALFSRPADVTPARKYGFTDENGNKFKDLDLLADGWIIAAPSRHASGARYAWITDGVPPSLPPALCAPLRARQVPHTRSQTAPADPRTIADGEGRHMALFRLAVTLQNQGLSEAAILGAITATNAERIRPPKSVDEIAAIVAAARRYEVRRDVLASEEFSAQVTGNLSVPVEPMPEIAPVANDRADELQAIWRAMQEVITATEEAAPDPRAEHSRNVIDLDESKIAPVEVLPTWSRELDALLGGGIRSGSPIVVAGIPGGGKSAWTLHTVLHALAAEPTREAIIISTELDTVQMRARIAAHVRDRESWRDIERGVLPSAEINASLRAAVGIDRLRVVGGETIPRSTDHALMLIAIEIVQSLARTGLAPIVVVDYLQDMARGGADDARARVGALSGKLRAIATISRCFMILVSTISRGAYAQKSGDPEAWLAAVKESGDIEYDAGVIIILRPGERDEARGDRPVAMMLPKVRAGSTGEVGARFAGATCRWLPDANAVAEASTSKRAARDDAKIAEEKEQAILSRIAYVEAKHDEEALEQKSALFTAIGGNRGLFDAAIARLLQSERIKQVDATWYDVKSVRRTRSRVFRIARAVAENSLAKLLKEKSDDQ